MFLNELMMEVEEDEYYSEPPARASGSHFVEHLEADLDSEQPKHTDSAEDSRYSPYDEGREQSANTSHAWSPRRPDTSRACGSWTRASLCHSDNRRCQRTLRIDHETGLEKHLAEVTRKRILRDEGHIRKLISYLTKQTAEKRWKHFQPAAQAGTKGPDLSSCDRRTSAAFR